MITDLDHGTLTQIIIRLNGEFTKLVLREYGDQTYEVYWDGGCLSDGRDSYTTGNLQDAVSQFQTELREAFKHEDFTE